MSDREAKREQFSEKPSTGKKLLIPIVVLVLAVVAAGGWFLVGPQAFAGHEVVHADQTGKVLLAAADYADGKARFYRFDARSGPIDFFVVRSADGVIRTAFDTCDVCYRERKGYRQEGNDMVCNNCDQHFRTDLVNVVKGGCNPTPLRRQQQGETVAIAVKDIEQGAGYFKTAIN